MASDLHWVHTFCLSCDRQTDGATYCSESCRLADYEDTSSSTSSGPNSPSWASPASTYPWSTSSMGPTTTNHRKFLLSPAYDFSNPQPYGSTPTLYHDNNTYNYYRQQHGSHHHHQAAASRRPPTTATSPTIAGVGGAFAVNSMALPPTTATATTSVTYHHVISPSSSQSSLSSMRSNTSMGAVGALGALSAFATGGSGQQPHYGSSSSSSNGGDLSGKARSELRKYASSLEQCKLQRQLLRRRSC